MPTTYILVDFENVQPEDLPPLQGGPYQLRVFLGSQQAKLPRKLVVGMQRLAAAADYVEIEGQGRNALDFHIACYLGKLAAENPGSTFRVVSRDTGFDALIEHLNQQGIPCARLETLDALSPPAAASLSVPETLGEVMGLLTGMKSAKPRSLKTLRSTISKKLGAAFREAELEPLIEALQENSFLVVDKARVRYASDAA